MAKRRDLTGKRFGMLYVLKYSHNHPETRSPMWLCRCDCGTEKVIHGYSLTRGDYKSCGCVRGEKSVAGLKRHAENDSVDGTRVTALKSKLHVANKSGHKGVRYNEQRQKWTAHIGFKGKQINLGYFTNKEDAVKAREKAEEKYHHPYLVNADKLYGVSDIAEALNIAQSSISAKYSRAINNNFSTFPSPDGHILRSKRPFWRESTLIANDVLNDDNVLKRDTHYTDLFRSYDGRKFGKLTVMSEIFPAVRKGRMLRCLCDCGNETSVSLYTLASGDTQSCGCKPIIRHQPGKNSKTGVPGVYEHHTKAGIKYGAKLGYNKKRYFLGIFDTIEDAAAAKRDLLNRLVAEDNNPS